MKKQYIEEIVSILNNLDESNLLYILTYVKKLFGGGCQ